MLRWQPTTAHLMYEVDWTGWLTREGYEVLDIEEITASIIRGPGDITYSESEDGVFRFWLNGTEAQTKTVVEVLITMPKPDPSAPNVVDSCKLEFVGI
jgi:hypothetical protein